MLKAQETTVFAMLCIASLVKAKGRAEQAIERI